ERWVAAERQLARWAQEYHADQLSDMGRRLLDGLDQDGAEPDHELDNQTNELHLTANHSGIGGRIRGELDSVTFDALVQVIQGRITPRDDEGKTLAERQADAFGEMCEHALDSGSLPECAGVAPHLTVTVSYDSLNKGLRGGSLTATGCRIGPREIRRLACTAELLPLVLAAGANRSMSGGPNATPPATSGLLSPCVTTDVPTPDAPPRRIGARPTTSSTGSTGVTPTSTIWCCCAVHITE
ncbi:MAG TPA: DUF222 domain-containing protein, partial [Pseudonocardia sp.]|nr:DUF222 domain-containing protein [Pseudonocardia sp.]